jgi:hypothetical protein
MQRNEQVRDTKTTVQPARRLHFPSPDTILNHTWLEERG